MAKAARCTLQAASNPGSGASTPQNRRVRRLQSWERAGSRVPGSIAAWAEGRAASQRLGFESRAGFAGRSRSARLLPGSPAAATLRPPLLASGRRDLRNAKPRPQMESAEAPPPAGTPRRPLPPSSASQVPLTGARQVSTAEGPKKRAAWLS